MFRFKTTLDLEFRVGKILEPQCLADGEPRARCAILAERKIRLARSRNERDQGALAFLAEPRDHDIGLALGDDRTVELVPIMPNA